MRRQLFAVVVGWMTVLWLSACSGELIVSASEARCRELCEASLSCPSAGNARSSDCYSSCDDLEGLNRANDCHGEVDSLYNCFERHGICADLDVACADELDVYADCIADSCSTDPDRDICL